MKTDRFFVLVFVAIILQYGSIQGDAEEMILSSDSRANAVIVMPDSPTLVEKTAGNELKSFLDQISGASFKKVPISQFSGKEQAIYVGDSPKVRALLPDLDLNKLGYDGIVIESVGKDLVLVGHPKRGTLYAVYTFLEDQLGVRWWSDSESFIPHKPTIKIPSLKIRYSPQLISREAHYRIAFDGVFSARLKQNNSSRTRMNGNRAVISPEYGDNDHFIFYKGRGSILHSFFEILPPDVYFEKHPDWYSEIDGKRVWDHAQLCLTNMEMRKEFVKNARKLLREDPSAKFISITQNDWNNPCTCAQCAAIDHENGDAHSGSLLDFVNWTAAELEPEFPGIFIETLAYHFTRKAPAKIRPRHNVVIRLCSIECSFLFPIEEDPRNADFVSDVKQWSQQADRLFIWNYVTMFHSYMIPHPNMRGLVKDLRFFVNNHAVGLFEQGDAFCLAGDFVRLRNWVLSHLMWNPDLDENVLYDEFMNGYYGKEVGAIFKEYLKLIHDRAVSTNIKLGCFMEDVIRWMDYPTFKQALKLMDQAEEMALRLEKSDPAAHAGLLAKVRRERIPMDHAALIYYYHFAREAQRRNEPYPGPSDPIAAAQKLIRLWNDLHVETWREFTTHDEFIKYQADLVKNVENQMEMLRLVNQPLKNGDFTQSLKKGTWLDFQEFDMILRWPGLRTNRIKDPLASNGYAAQMPGDHTYWAIHLFFPEKLWKLAPISGGSSESAQDPQFRIIAFARIDAKAENGTAFSFGVFDPKPWKPIFQKNISVSQVGKKEYQKIDLGVWSLPKSAYFWMAPINEPNRVSSVYLDRIVIIREK